MSPSLRAIVAACVVAAISAERSKVGDQAMDVDEEEKAEAMEDVNRGGTTCCWKFVDGKWDGTTVGYLAGNEKGCNVITDSSKPGEDKCVDDARAKTLKLIYEVEVTKPKVLEEVKTAQAAKNTSITTAEAKNTKAIADAVKTQQQSYADALKKFDEEQVKKKQEEDIKLQKARDNSIADVKATLEKELTTETIWIENTFKTTKAKAEKTLADTEANIDKKIAEDYEKKKESCEGNKNCCCKIKSKGMASKVPKTYDFTHCDKVVPYVEAWATASSCNYYEDCEQCTKKMCKDGNCHSDEEPEEKKSFFSGLR